MVFRGFFIEESSQTQLKDSGLTPSNFSDMPGIELVVFTLKSEMQKGLEAHLIVLLIVCFFTEKIVIGWVKTQKKTFNRQQCLSKIALCQNVIFDETFPERWIGRTAPTHGYSPGMTQISHFKLGFC